MQLFQKIKALRKHAISFSICAIFIALFVTPTSPAYAQYVCPNGAGPGEKQIGMTGVPPVQYPVCVRVDAGAVESEEDDSGSKWPGYSPIAASFMALAYHSDTSSVWESSAHMTAESAERRVLDACAAAMGEGCALGATVKGVGHIAVVRDAMGITWVKGLPFRSDDPRAAKREAMEICANNSFGCVLLREFESGLVPLDADGAVDYSENIFPTGEARRHIWAFTVRPETPPAMQWQGKAWLVSGQQNSEQALSQVLGKCRQDSGKECVVEAFAANGALVHIKNSKGHSQWVSSADSGSVKARVSAVCSGADMPCRIVAVYDAATPRLEVVDVAD